MVNVLDCFATPYNFQYTISQQIWPHLFICSFNFIDDVYTSCNTQQCSYILHMATNSKKYNKSYLFLKKNMGCWILTAKKILFCPEFLQIQSNFAQDIYSINCSFISKLTSRLVLAFLTVNLLAYYSIVNIKVIITCSLNCVCVSYTKHMMFVHANNLHCWSTYKSVFTVSLIYLQKSNPSPDLSVHWRTCMLFSPFCHATHAGYPDMFEALYFKTKCGRKNSSGSERFLRQL